MNSSDESNILTITDLKPGEQIDDLQTGGFRIIQKRKGFRFGTDSVLLADFAFVKAKARVADFGSGCGIISVLLCAHRKDITVSALEIQSELAEMSQRSVLLNSLQNRIRVVNGDVKNALKLIGGSFDCVVCNPPYYSQTEYIPSSDESAVIARSDFLLTPDEMCASAFKVLKTGGRLNTVFPAAKMHEMLYAMKDSRLAPKRIRTVHETAAHAPSLVLIDAVKQGGAGLKWLPPLILSNADGSRTDEWKRIYG